MQTNQPTRRAYTPATHHRITNHEWAEQAPRRIARNSTRARQIIARLGELNLVERIRQAAEVTPELEKDVEEGRALAEEFVNTLRVLKADGAQPPAASTRAASSRQVSPWPSVQALPNCPWCRTRRTIRSG